MILDKNEDPELIYENIWRMHKKKLHRICKPVKKSEEKKADMDLIKSPWRFYSFNTCHAYISISGTRDLCLLRCVPIDIYNYK